MTVVNGITYTSTALTPSQLDTVFQSVTTQMLGIAPTDPQANFKVRLSWQTQGAPAYGINDDVVFIRCREIVTEYSTIRDQTWSMVDSVYAQRTRSYSRMWNVFFRARGPNSFDTVRLIKSMLLEDFVHDTLAQSQLYMITEMGTPVRVPELYEGQWWEQVDFNADFLEQVTETMTATTITGVEIIGQTDIGTTFDVKVGS